jgi:hypothetical protein
MIQNYRFFDIKVSYDIIRWATVYGVYASFPVRHEVIALELDQVQLAEFLLEFGSLVEVL